MTPTLTEAVTAYSDELASLGRSANTIRAYGTYLNRFATICDDITVGEIRPEHMTAFFTTIDTQATRNLGLASVRGFLRWAVRMGYLPADAAAAAMGPRKARHTERQPKHYIPVSEFPAALKYAGNIHPLDRVVIALGLFTMCRQSELTAIQLKHVNLGARTIRVWRQKRQRWTDVTISPDLHGELKRWLDWYAGTTGQMSPDWYLIPHMDRRPPISISPERPHGRLEYIVKRVLDRLGVVGRPGRSVRHLGEGIHTLRRSAARALLDHLEGRWGADRALNMVMAMLDHEDRQMTLKYIGLNIDKARLDEWMRDHPMYGDLCEPQPDASVINMRRPLHKARSGAAALA